MYGYIYKTTNISNGKIYIGKHKCTYFDADYHGSGVILKEAVAKHGVENFVTELIEECEDIVTLNQREQYWIDVLNARDLNIGYNVAPGGDGGIVWQPGKHPSLGIRRCGSDNPFYGKHHTEQTKSKQKATWKRKIANGYVSPSKGIPNKYKGTIIVYKESNSKRIDKTELPVFEADGWRYPYKRYGEVVWGMTGKTQSEYQKQRAHQTHKGKSFTDKQLEQFHKTMDSKSVDELALISKRKSDSHKGKIWVTDGTNNKQINPDEYQEYEYFGFYWGRTAR